MTSVLDVIAKPALITWAANQERDLVTQVANDVYRDSLAFPERLSGTAFSTTLSARLPKQRQFAKRANDAANIGVRVHAHIENALLASMGHKVPDLLPMPEAQKATDAFDEWAQNVGLVPIVVEAKVLNETVGYAGTLDAIVEITHNGDRIHCVADWKTSNGIYDEYLLQIAAYANSERADNVAAFNEALAGGTVLKTSEMHGLIMRFDKKQVGLMESVVVSPEDMKSYFDTFVNIKKVWDWFHRKDTL